ncbi:MBL fold metallo-hydrolase [Aeropyrum camini]|uniref:MBL fold metallo-hydrolase n=1 Tax=Aeropyrum camini TaxID=229980 RepID=UPI000787D03B|nr:MBL fold metallo-hydrolase [Aeropyrum camini]
MSLLTLAGDTMLLKGSPSTLLYKHGDTVFLVDPGHGKKRAKQLSKAVEKLGGEAVAIVTHFHSDHFSTLYQASNPPPSWPQGRTFPWLDTAP